MARKPADQSVSREDILAAAANVLHRHGYEATTMKDIAAEVNLTAASLYHHFRNKDTLLLAVLENGIDLVTKQLEPIVQSEQSCTDKLTEMVRIHVGNVTRNTAVGAAMIFEIRSLLNASPRNGSSNRMDAEAFAERRRIFFEKRDYFESLFTQVIHGGVANGEFREVDVTVLVKTMMGANNWVSIWYKEGGRLNGDEIAAMMADGYIRLLKP